MNDIQSINATIFMSNKYIIVTIIDTHLFCKRLLSRGGNTWNNKLFYPLYLQK